jgi:TonB family protein
MISGPILSHAAAPPKSRVGLYVGLAVIVLALATGGIYWWMSRPAGQGAAQVSPEMAAALKRAAEAEARLKAIDEEKRAAVAKAEADIKQKMEEDAAANNRAVNAAAVKRAQDEAARKAAADQEKKAQDEKARLVQEAKAAEEQREREDERRKAEEAERARQTASVTAPVATPPPTPPPTPGTYSADDANIIASPAQCPRLEYPDGARRLRISGTVRLFLSIDEAGRVSDARVLSGPEALRPAAIEYYRKQCKFRPATTKDGRPVRVTKTVAVVYQL